MIEINSITQIDATDMDKIKTDEKKMVDFKSELYNIYLRSSCRQGNLDIMLSIYKNISNINLNSMDSYNHTLLYIAVKRGHVAIVEWLLKQSVNVEISDKNGLTPLMVSAYIGHDKICGMLLEAGSEVSVRDYRGYTAM